MRKALSGMLAIGAVLLAVGCQPQPEVGPVVHRDGKISEVRYGHDNSPYKAVTLTGTSACSLDERVEIYGTLTQGDVRTSLEGGFSCEAGKTVEWSSEFGDNFPYQPDARLQPGDVSADLSIEGMDSMDRVRIIRTVTLAGS